MEERLKDNIPMNDAEIRQIITGSLPWTKDAATGTLALKFEYVLRGAGFWEDINLTGNYTDAIKYLRNEFSPSAGKVRARPEPPSAMKHGTAPQERLLHEVRLERIKTEVASRSDVRTFREQFSKLKWLDPMQAWTTTALIKVQTSKLLAVLGFDQIERMWTKQSGGSLHSGALAAISWTLTFDQSKPGTQRHMQSKPPLSESRWELFGFAQNTTDGNRESPKVLFASGSSSDSDVLEIETVNVGTVDRVRGAKRTAEVNGQESNRIWGLRGSVIGEALQIADEIAATYPLSVAEALQLIFTNLINPRPIIQGFVTDFPLDSMQDNYSTRAVGPIILIIDPFVSTEGITAFWSDYQEFIYRGQDPTAQNRSTFRFRAPSEDVVESAIEDIKLRSQGQGSRRRSWNDGEDRIKTFKQRKRSEATSMPTPEFIQDDALRSLLFHEEFIKSDDQPNLSLMLHRMNEARKLVADSPPRAAKRWQAIATHWEEKAVATCPTWQESPEWQAMQNHMEVIYDRLYPPLPDEGTPEREALESQWREQAEWLPPPLPKPSDG